jgi:serine/threonine protein phosphatase 1
LPKSRLLAVSDIHGHQDALNQLLQQADYDPSSDRLILLGDYINADDESSYGTLDQIRQLVSQGAIALLGNQELRLAKPRNGELRFPKHWSWLSSLPLYTIQDHFLLVHAGIRPGIPLERQSVRDLTEIRDDFIRSKAERFGELGRYTIVFGHTPTHRLGTPPGKLWYGDNRIGIDTGAKHGHRLTLVNLHEGISYGCSTAPAL